MPKQANSYDLRKYLGLLDLPMGPLSQTFLYDPVNGSDNNTGNKPGSAIPDSRRGRGSLCCRPA